MEFVGHSCVPMMSSLGCTEFVTAIPSQKLISEIKYCIRVARQYGIQEKMLRLLAEENIGESKLGSMGLPPSEMRRSARRGGSSLER